ncbi:ARP2/3 complex subunit [Trypanosoma rangeli]|uniref:Actin-related protein 2/3 complex subunit 5 n=1 Tax=Trypanosoma rangeli TaxID=5698 RepID=A0A422NDK4_TRYRA|nr:ARP2/3 complex subunit [Trypanosoma rangeli]RNF03584.1 ARP2/3 complex subunit [Trypanosoma rangeli]|eukprot:RNF03584.1 ARP2/3 complex subunit [Trypanosoma rangeli]
MPELAQLLDKLHTTHFSDMTFSTVSTIANYIKGHANNSSNIDENINTLSTNQQDTLMKVLYCCLANDSGSSATYFRWHEKLYRTAGSGAIIRVMTDMAT